MFPVSPDVNVTVNTEAKKNNIPPVTPFALYSFRHTFLTRLGRSGCDAWTLARIAGTVQSPFPAATFTPQKTPCLLRLLGWVGTILRTANCRCMLTRVNGSC
jgi:hypothetical protein